MLAELDTTRHHEFIAELRTALQEEELRSDFKIVEHCLHLIFAAGSEVKDAPEEFQPLLRTILQLLESKGNEKIAQFKHDFLTPNTEPIL